MPGSVYSEVGRAARTARRPEPHKTLSRSTPGRPSMSMRRIAIAASVLPASLVAQARAEFEDRRGNGSYIPFVGDREPPLDYRRSTRN